MNKDIFDLSTGYPRPAVCKLGCIGSTCVHYVEINEVLPFIKAQLPSYSCRWEKEDFEEEMLLLAGTVQYYLLCPGERWWKVPGHRRDVVMSFNDSYMKDLIQRVSFYLKLRKAAEENAGLTEIDDGSISDFGPQMVVPAVEIHESAYTPSPQTLIVVKDVSAAALKDRLDFIAEECGIRNSEAPALTAAMLSSEHDPMTYDLTGLVKPGDRYWKNFNFWYDPYKRCYRSHNIFVCHELSGVPFGHEYDPPGLRFDRRSGRIVQSLKDPD